jgi:hypothetical protein
MIVGVPGSTALRRSAELGACRRKIIPLAPRIIAARTQGRDGKPLN